MLYGEALFHVGIGVMCAAAGIAVSSIVIFIVTGRRLERALDTEYGRKRHD